MAMLSQMMPPSATTEPARPLERLASGRRVNGARDDAAGLAIATMMDARVRSRRVAARNIRDALHVTSMLDQALDQIADRLVRLRELALTSLNDTIPQSHKLGGLFRELWATRRDITRIARNARIVPTTNKNLAQGFDLEVAVGIETDPDTLLTLTLPSVSGRTITDGAGNALNSAWIGNDSRSRVTLDIADGGLDLVNEVRATIGAFQNRLLHALAVNDVTMRTTEAARSGIEDADVGVETTALVRAFGLREGREGLGRLVRELDQNAVRQLLDA